MDPQVFNIIKKIRAALKDKTEATLTDVEIAYITGQLDSIVEIFSDPKDLQTIDSITGPGEKPGIIRRFLGGE